MSELIEAAPGDAPLVADLHVRSWRSAYRGVLPDAYLDGPLAAEKQAHWSGLLADPPPGAVILIARDAGKALGFVAAYPEPPDGALVDNLHVLPERRGQGIGRRLLRAAAARLHRAGVRRLRLSVFRGNGRALGFYRRLGGRVVGEGVHRAGGFAAPDYEMVWSDLDALLDGGTPCQPGDQPQLHG